MSDDAWTPYGLEAIRIGHLRRRRFALVGALLVAALLWGFFAPKPTDASQIEVFANGVKQGTGNAIKIDAPEKQKPVTVAIQPGKLTYASAGAAALPASNVGKASAPAQPRAVPVPWAAYAIKFGPYALLGLALLALGKRKRTTHQVNYGIYKGALPLELVSASASKRIFTGRKAASSIFGKDRADYLPPEVERVPQDTDGPRSVAPAPSGARGDA